MQADALSRLPYDDDDRMEKSTSKQVSSDVFTITIDRKTEATPLAKEETSAVHNVQQSDKEEGASLHYVMQQPANQDAHAVKLSDEDIILVDHQNAEGMVTEITLEYGHTHPVFSLSEDETADQCSTEYTILPTKCNLIQLQKGMSRFLRTCMHIMYQMTEISLRTRKRQPT